MALRDKVNERVQEINCSSYFDMKEEKMGNMHMDEFRYDYQKFHFQYTAHKIPFF